jgi:hypothetical protein
MAPLGQNLTHSVDVVRRKLLQMMDALAESGMRHAHREITRAYDVTRGKQKQPGGDKRKEYKNKSTSVH